MNQIILLFCMSLCMCRACYAGGSVPMGMILYPDTLFFLLPSIFMKMLVFKGILPRLPWKQTVKAITLSNLASAVAGGICVALPMILLEIFFLFSVLGHTWLKMDEGFGGHILREWATLHDLIFRPQALALNGPQHIITVVLLMALFMAPFYCFSVWIEGKVNQRHLQGVANPLTIKKLTWCTNGVSFAFVTLALSYISIKNPNVLMTEFEFMLSFLWRS